ncbi:dual specificity protein phosphatase 1-A-like [Pristis pectinata]|uniref:dual specificity protein phosphatase 1-A-like n=1 Tax=Pristis pectinata TaxID=685728 RepID=UPI00223E566A|nr:dual specificity protein phosphatase 1-A-like [Pristis pectinata]XP_051897118.1 dual specificity protein phosphatase 1-A-like [Pristis pectinata]
MVTTESLEIESCHLVQLMVEEQGPILILDCRSFLSFNASHIRGSHNVYCNTIVKRRSKGAIALDCILPEDSIRAGLSCGSYPRVLVLDERSASVATLGRDSTARLVLNTLSSQLDTSTLKIYFLKGGYETFHSLFPEMCTEALSAYPPAGSVPTLIARGTPLYDQGGPVEILPFLYLGSAYHSSRKETLQSLGITALLNVSSNCPNCFEGVFQYKCIPVEDSHMTDISAWFQEAIDFIDSVKNSGGRVLVHCQAGISRSATICLAYLIRTQRVRLEEAFDFVKQRRGVISPNFAFMGQLLQFETKVLCH